MRDSQRLARHAESHLVRICTDHREGRAIERRHLLALTNVLMNLRQAADDDARKIDRMRRHAGFSS